jgi:peptidyl-tRNA hydrolase, PTH1 family
MAIELVAGLGNPGGEYERTRHNAGFAVVQELADRLRAARWARRCSSRVALAGRGRSVLLAQPQTFMNRSGAAVSCLAAELGLRPEQILVVVDDVDLPLGRLRLRRSGGPGTRNGLRDVVGAIGTGFPRLRLGVRGRVVAGDLADYVLSPFAPDEETAAGAMLSRAADAVQAALYVGVDRAMVRFNALVSPG